MMDEMKTCNKCGIEKSLVDFSKNKNKKDGHNITCKKCRARYYLSNKESINAKGMLYYESNKERHLKQCAEYKEKHKEWYKQWYKERYLRDKEKLAAQAVVRYEKNKIKIKANVKKWCEENRDMRRKNANNYAKKATARISDSYICGMIGLPIDEVREFIPEVLDLKRLAVQEIRLSKQLKKQLS